MSERPFFVIHPAAVEEAEKATRWYRQRSARAGAQFVEEVNHAIDSLEWGLVTSRPANGRCPGRLFPFRQARFGPPASWTEVQKVSDP